MVTIITIGFMLFDFITGIISAIKNKKFNSTIMREGGFHKLGSLSAIFLGCGIDYAQQYFDLGFQVNCSLAISVYICLMEIGSSIENIGRINPNLVPDKLKNVFVKLQKEGENE